MAYQDVRRGEPITVLVSTARTATPTVDTFHIVGGAEQMFLVIDCTADPASASVVFTIKGVDPVSTKTWDVLASAAITGTGTTVLRVTPHLTAVNNTIAKDPVPAFFTVTAVHADTDSITYSVAAQAV